MRHVTDQAAAQSPALPHQAAPRRDAVRVAITGTHNSGKTTLCHQIVGLLMKQGVKASYAPEPSRTSRYLAEGRRDFATQLDILVMTVANELEAARSSDIAICDRTPIDVLAYTEALGAPSTPTQQAFSDTIRALTDNYSPSYQSIFKVGWAFDMEASNDPLRIGDNRFQDYIDQRIIYHLDRLHLPVIALESPDSAADMVERHVLRLLRPTQAAGSGHRNPDQPR